MRAAVRSILLIALAALIGISAFADDHPGSPVFSSGEKFDEQTGETLYAGICQGCHMANAKGAAGAGRYPALANNPKLKASGYPVAMVLRGLNGMPAIGTMLSDAQVAQVVNYVRTHFGNNYTDAVKPEDVKALR
jgi:mono/diheme cytochrome c family protein